MSTLDGNAAPDYQYTLADYDPLGDETPREWATRYAAEGWHTWAGRGTWVNIDGRRLARWSLRRERPPRTPQTEDGNAG